MELTTVILTGGASHRMGRDKGSLPVGEETLLEHLARRWSGLFSGVAAAVGQHERPLPAGVRPLLDRYSGAGPMAGLEAGLSACPGGVFLTAVDMPFGDPALARVLLQRLEGADVCLIRRRSGRLEPLFAVYGPGCLTPVRESLERGERSFVYGLFPRVAVRAVEEGELPGFDLERILCNVNRPEDWAAVRPLLQKRSGETGIFGQTVV